MSKRSYFLMALIGDKKKITDKHLCQLGICPVVIIGLKKGIYELKK